MIRAKASSSDRPVGASPTAVLFPTYGYRDAADRDTKCLLAQPAPVAIRADVIALGGAAETVTTRAGAK